MNIYESGSPDEDRRLLLAREDDWSALERRLVQQRSGQSGTDRQQTQDLLDVLQTRKPVRRDVVQLVVVREKAVRLLQLARQ